jgi:hypothetical protein
MTVDLKPGELLETPNGTISSQAARGIGLAEGSETRGLSPNNNIPHERPATFSKTSFGFSKKFGNRRHLFVSEKMLIKATMMRRAKRNCIPRSVGSTLGNWDQMCPVANSVFAADDAERCFVSFSPMPYVCADLLLIFGPPSSLAFLQDDWVRLFPLFIVSVATLAISLGICFLPTIFVQLQVARAAISISLVWLVGGLAISA